VNNDTRLGLAAVGIVALCCAGPLLVSLVASGAVLSAIHGSAPLLLAMAAVLSAAVVLLWRRGRASESEESKAGRDMHDYNRARSPVVSHGEAGPGKDQQAVPAHPAASGAPTEAVVRVIDDGAGGRVAATQVVPLR
jgi:hypothetical protein